VTQKLQTALEEIFDKADNALHALALPMPPALHVEGLKGILKDIKTHCAAALPPDCEAIRCAKERGDL
jgi:hypothetical protein